MNDYESRLTEAMAAIGASQMERIEKLEPLLHRAAEMLGNMVVSWSLTPEKEEMQKWVNDYYDLFPPPKRLDGEPF